MADVFDICLAFTLREDGSYVDDPADPCGATNMGITLATYREWSDEPDLGDLQVQDMTLKTARAICRARYWNPLRADALPPRVDLSVFDMGVNAVIWRSARLLQRALGFTGEEVGGSIGPETLAAADRFDVRTPVNNLADRTLVVERAGEVGNKHHRPRSRPTMTKSAGSVRAISAASASTHAAISAAVKRTRIPLKLISPGSIRRGPKPRWRSGWPPMR